MPAGTMSFAEYSRAFALGFTEVFDDTLKLLPRTYTAFLEEQTAENFYDTYWSHSGLGAMQVKNIGTPFTTDKLIQGGQKQMAMTPYGMACVVEYEALRWDLYNFFKGLPQELAKSCTDRYNIVGHSVLNNSFSAPNSTYQIFASNVAENIISTTHTRLDGGTWSNGSSGSVGLSYLGVQEGRTTLAKTVNQRGMFGTITAKRIITSEDQRWVAETLVGSQYRPDNSNLALNTMKGLYDIYASPYITSTTAWWMEADPSDVNIKMRLGDKPKSYRDNAPSTLNVLMAIYASFDLHVYDSRGIWGSAGA